MVFQLVLRGSTIHGEQLAFSDLKFASIYALSPSTCPCKSFQNLTHRGKVDYRRTDYAVLIEGQSGLLADLLDLPSVS